MAIIKLNGNLRSSVACSHRDLRLSRDPNAMMLTRRKRHAAVVAEFLFFGVTFVAGQAQAIVNTVDEVQASDLQFTFDPDLGQHIDYNTSNGNDYYGIVQDGVRKSYHPIQGLGEHWQVLTTGQDVPYRGNSFWHSYVTSQETEGPNGRSENVICKNIQFGDTVYFSFAFNADALSLDDDGWAFIAQLWQSGGGKPPVFLAIKDDDTSTPGNSKLELVKRDYINDNYSGGPDADDERTSLWSSAWSLEEDTWYHLNLTLKPSRGSDGVVRLRMMNHQTGLWEMLYDSDNDTNFDGQVGKAHDPSETPELKFKLGGYMGWQRDWSVLYDWIRYGKYWGQLTRSNLLGYAKDILYVGWNSTDQSSRGNDLTLKNGAYWDGTWLTLDGANDFAEMLKPTTYSNGLADFDVGNQLRIETQFQVAGDLNGTTGVFYAQAGSDEGYGIVVKNDRQQISFVIGHPDGTSTWVHKDIYVELGTLYRAIGTYNRFGNYTFEVIEGGASLGVDTRATNGKPIATPDRVWLGRRKNFFLDGRIDYVKVTNNAN